MKVFNVGEKVHIVEKRLFVDDVRRHFIGEVVSFSESALRLKGYVWVYNHTQAKFTRRNELREKILILGDRIIINVLPKDIDIKEVIYNVDNVKRMMLTDGRGFELELSEFLKI